MNNKRSNEWNAQNVVIKDNQPTLRRTCHFAYNDEVEIITLDRRTSPKGQYQDDGVEVFEKFGRYCFYRAYKRKGSNEQSLLRYLLDTFNCLCRFKVHQNIMKDNRAKQGIFF